MWVRKLVSGSFTRRLRRALDGDTANAGSEYNDKLYAVVTVIERGYSSTWTHLLEDWLISQTPSLRNTSHLARVYANTLLHFYPLRGFLTLNAVNFFCCCVIKIHNIYGY